MLQIITESMLWIAITIASLVIYGLIVWTPKTFYKEGFIITEIHAYYDGKYVHTFATIKNTGNVLITRVGFELTVGGSNPINVRIED